MGDLIQLGNILRDREFYNEVAPFIESINPAFQHYKSESEAVFYFNYKMSVFIFMKYIENGEETNHPSLQDSLENVRYNPRVSKGEWVIDRLSELKPDESKPLFKLIYQKNKSETFIQDLKNVLFDN